MQIYILNPMPFDGSGPSQTCLKIAEEMSRAGHETYIFGARKKVYISGNITFYSPFWNIGRYIPYRYTRSFFNFWLHKYILRKVPDNSIVYAWPSTDYSTLEILKEKGCKIFVETINLHTLTEKSVIEREMEAEQFFYTHYVTDEKINNQVNSHALCDHVFVSNEYAFESVVDAGVAEDKIFLTRYGGDEPSIGKDTENQQSDNKHRFIFVFVGRVNMEKGVHKLLKAWRLANVDAELHLYGNADTNMVKRYQALFEQKGVRIMGHTNNIDKVYDSSDAFIFLSLAEGGPLVSIEAAFHKLPMIVSPKGGGRIAQHNKTALIVDPDDTEAVACAIERIFRERSLRQKLSQNAYTSAKKEFTWKKAAEERVHSMKTL